MHRRQIEMLDSWFLQKLLLLLQENSYSLLEYTVNLQILRLMFDY